MTDAATARHIEMLETLTDCAGALAVTAHDLAMALLGSRPEQFIALAAESRQSGFAARMGVKLIHALKAGPLPARAPSLRTEAAEREPSAAARDADRERPERESEGESEPVSVPLFLKTLRAVATDVERRKADLPAETRDGVLPKLHALLAEAEAPPAPAPKAAAGVAVFDRPPSPPPARSTRARLLSSTLPPGLNRRRDSG